MPSFNFHIHRKTLDDSECSHDDPERGVKDIRMSSHPSSPMAARHLMEVSTSSPSASSTSIPRGGQTPPEFAFQVLRLDRESLCEGPIRNTIYVLVHGTARLLPAFVIYGGTLGLLVCAVYKYRWGVLCSLTLYTVYMFIQCFALLVFSLVGLGRVWQDSRVKWYAKYSRWRERADKSGEKRPLSLDWKETTDLLWNDIIHIVMLPSYKTPIEVLRESIQHLEKYEWAQTHMGVVLAFEQRELDVDKKAQQLCSEFEGHFRFLTVSYHPADLPGHVPGKSSNECWAFQHACAELEAVHGISRHDPRVLMTVMDDDSEFHENYFEALTYHYITAPPHRRCRMTFQPPICHFKNYLRQPLVVRVSSLFATLSELASLANPFDCHVNYSSYSLSLSLASAVGGWDPDYLAEDWHMFAKCSLKTGGLVKCQPIFLPLLNYTPEEESYLGTCRSRWEQAKRHALGVSELVYVIQGLCLACFELRGWGRRLVFFWRLCPVLGKFTQVHFMNGMSTVFTLLAQFVIHFYMWRSWCYVSALSSDQTCALLMHDATQEGIAEEQIVLNSLMVHWQQRFTAAMAAATVLSGGFGAWYFHLVRDRVEGDVDKHCFVMNPIVHWINVELAVSTVGWIASLMYGALPLWIAVYRIICQARFTHVVAGMVGRSIKFDD
mmetsp:Transcript_63148/g.133301  ORF Transcript_63148/g.133301 Transcript_63148/m.133301 type:complete len:664 (+) Transcript_63148:490-2481(+)